MEKLNSEPLLMLGSAIGVVLILFVVLTVVIANMRIRTYKNRFINTRVDNETKAKHIAQLQQEVQMLKSMNERKSSELEQFDTVKLRLQETELALKEIQNAFGKLEKLQGQTQNKLDNSEQMYATLKEEHEAIQHRLEALAEENQKLKVNNARLLMKLEKEEQFASQLQERSDAANGKKGS